MKLVLDEMWTPVIAIELRKLRYRAIAINEREHSGRYAGLPDDEVFARAQEDRCTVVTDNIPDFEKARLDWQATGREHYGVIYALNPPFNRHRGDAVIGQMIMALVAFLNSDAAHQEPLNRAHYLRRA